VPTAVAVITAPRVAVAKVVDGRLYNDGDQGSKDQERFRGRGRMSGGERTYFDGTTGFCTGQKLHHVITIVAKDLVGGNSPFPTRARPRCSRSLWKHMFCSELLKMKVTKRFVRKKNEKPDAGLTLNS